jgi:hypothetical protein
MHPKFRKKTLSAQKNYIHDKGEEAHNFFTQMYSINL